MTNPFRPGTGPRLVIAGLAVVANALCNHLQHLAPGSTAVPESLHRMIASYGEAFTGTVALGAFLHLCGVRPLAVVVTLLCLGAIWEGLQTSGAIPGTADVVGDSIAYACGAALGVAADHLVTRTRKSS